MSELLAIIQKPWRIQRLKRKYYQLSFQGTNEAKKSLQRQLAILKSKCPGYSEVWYLEKVIYDFEKDRQ